VGFAQDNITLDVVIQAGVGSDRRSNSDWGEGLNIVTSRDGECGRGMK
jgi:hypothetical protein